MGSQEKGTGLTLHYGSFIDTENEDYKVHAGCELIYDKDSLLSNKVKTCTDLPSDAYRLQECRLCDDDVCSALNCYTCESDKLDGCIKANNPKSVACGAATQGFQSVCLYKVLQDTAKKIDKVHSGCELIAASAAVSKESIPDCMTPPAGMTVKECKVCNSELCNSSAMTGASVISILCLPLMYLVSKYVLS
ncbi:hypothetical protein FQA39_LY11105 [Lamprigera yunnana]|nr:hypothetical protein FQA39_LY11105 [Lamprigera yunnana]